jgi:2-dehydro-3-deoxyphosphogluconate aldolase/(4S)-4-hydroxy-2-oxoglutarate aldolase
MDVVQRISDIRVIPIIAIERLEDALPLADAVSRGGLPALEITFRTQAAPEVIALLKRERPNMLLGAGTILTPEQVETAQRAGAHFGISPGLNPSVLKKAFATQLPFFPGVMTPSEVEQALALGLKTLKFFPAEAAGGLKMLNALAGPYAHTDVRFIPLGGINMKNLADYLAHPLVVACGGTWIAPKESIARKEWAEIEKRARQAAEISHTKRLTSRGNMS